LPRKSKQADSTLEEMAESLGRFLGHAEAQWRASRQSLVGAVAAVRDRADALLKEMGGAVSEVSFPRAKPARSVKPVAATAKKVGRRVFTPEQRREQSERMKASWAARKKAAKKSTKKAIKKARKAAGDIAGNG
jgi:hypothetical protein